MISATESLQRLREGNRRYVSGDRHPDPYTLDRRRRELVEAQEPFAIVLGCSDSRVPVEMIFDQGPGDLFVVRVAGNIAAPSQIGSVEIAAQCFHARLVVVLGHTNCGAVQATVDTLRHPNKPMSSHLRSIVDHIRPSVESLLATDGEVDLAAVMQRAIRSNVHASVDHLQEGSDMLKQLTETDGLLIVGAQYDLETGMVDFFDGLPKIE